jgi:hypothetical protein
LNLVFTLHNDEFTCDELLFLGFFFFFNFGDGATYAKDPNDSSSPMKFPKNWAGGSPHIPNVHFPVLVLPHCGNLGEHCNFELLLMSWTIWTYYGGYGVRDVNVDLSHHMVFSFFLASLLNRYNQIF